MSVCPCVRTCVLCTRILTWVRVHVYMSARTVSVSLYLDVYVCVRTCVSLCAYVCVRTCLSVCVRVHTCVRIYAYVHMVFVRVRVYVFV